MMTIARETNATIRAQELTFGVEIETTVSSSTDMYIGGYHQNSGTSNLPYFQGSPWDAQRDGSIRCGGRGRMGCEFVSPILKGEAGLRNVMDVLAVIKAAHDGEGVEINGQTYQGKSGRVNNSCGIHVHVGLPEGVTVAAIQRISAAFAAYEDGLYAITGTRRREIGGYSNKIRGTHKEVMEKKTMEAFRECRASEAGWRSAGYGSSRYSGLNLLPLVQGRRNAVEFRLYSASLNPTKIAAFIQLSLAIVDLAMNLQTRPCKWDQDPATPKAYNQPTQAQREAERLLHRVGWIGSRKHGPIGIVGEGLGLPTRKAMVKELRRLATKYAEGS